MVGWGCLAAKPPPSPLYHSPTVGQGRESEQQKQEKLPLTLGGQDKDSLLHEGKNQTTTTTQTNAKVSEAKLSILFKISFFLSLDDSQLSIL